MPSLKTDGYDNFLGGMDSSRGPSVLGSNQYYYSVNMVLPKTADGISTRKGFRRLKINFETKRDKEIFESGNPQSSGYYKDTNYRVVILLSISGYVFELKEDSQFIYKARIINKGDQNLSNTQDSYIIRIPFGAIINDGVNASLYTSNSQTRRTKRNKREIGAGLAGVYVQNRLWYIRQNRREIFASTINEPLSLDEAYLDNIYGIMCPENDDIITAIGKQGTSGSDALGGNLAFATLSDFYSANVRGARTQWGITGGQGTGFVDKTIPGLGAVSPYSFEPYNSNIYFRHTSLGLVSLNQGKYEFVNRDSFTNQTSESGLFFSNDTKELLSRCWTKAYNKSIYTTVSPSINENGFVYWNGLIVKTPDPYYGKVETIKDITESVFTGIRPWNITVTNDGGIEKMFILSYDYDFVNRLYIYDESLTHDIDKDFNKKKIESQLLTRRFAFNSPLLPKKEEFASYSLSNIMDDVDVEIKTRTGIGQFKSVFKTSHIVCNQCRNGFLCCDSVLTERENVNFPVTKGEFFSLQDLIKITGSANLRRFVRVSLEQNISSNIHKPENCSISQKMEEPEKIFTYKIST